MVPDKVQAQQYLSLYNKTSVHTNSLTEHFEANVASVIYKSFFQKT